MIGRDSRYTGCILYRDGTGEFLGNRFSVSTSPMPDDRFHVVIEGDRLDVLAHKHLGDARLWWVISDCNDIFNPLELEVGTVLRVPSVERVWMGSKARNQ